MRQTRSRQHDRKCRLKSSHVKSIYFNHRSQGNSTNYYLILGLRDKAAPSTSQQINKFPPKRVKNLATPSSIFIFVFSSFTGELCSQPIRGNDRRIGRMFPEHVERRFLDPEYSFDEYFQLGSRRNIRPIKNGLNTVVLTVADGLFGLYGSERLDELLISTQFLSLPPPSPHIPLPSHFPVPNKPWGFCGCTAP